MNPPVLSLPLRQTPMNRLLLAVAWVLLAPCMGFAQNAIDLGATVLGPTSLRLDWTNSYANVNSVKLYRRVLGSSNWGSGTTLANTATTHTDTVVNATTYEYRLDIGTSDWQNFYGYLAAGVNVPLTESRGKILLMVDSSMSVALTSELEDLRRDLLADGWTVVRHDVARMATDPAATGTGPGAARLAELSAVKNLIVSAYNADPANVRQVLLIGRVPVPYSGNIAPDGHGDHSGAWPADAYYADVNGSWTDSSVDSTGASDARNWNIPGDGKFDQSSVAEAGLELAVGRVDFANMTIFPSAATTETELVRRYLRKAHDYRHKRGAYAEIQRRAIKVPWGEYATGALSSAYAGVGREASLFDQPAFPGESSPWFRWMEENPSLNYLIGFGQGAGNYEAAAYVGSSQDFGQRPSRAVFTSYFGSYFADWDSPNNFLRASVAGNALGDSLGLASMWSGRPYFYLHRMALGEPLGTATRASQHNSTQYLPAGSSALGVHAGLLGDPALRLYSVDPPRNLRAPAGAGTITLEWDAVADAAGYLVYSAESEAGPFTKRTASPQAQTIFADSVTPGLSRTYYVRTVKTETSPGGTFQNASSGSWITIVSGAAATPSTPTGLLASIQSSGNASVSWNDNSTDETGFRLERKAGSSGTFATVANLAPNTTTHFDSGPFSAGTVYYYRVVATGANGDSAFSEVAAADAHAGYIHPGASVVSLDRASGQVQLSIRRLGGKIGAVGVSYSTADGSASAGQHFAATSGTLQWTDGDAAEKVVTIPMLSAGNDAPRTFRVNLSNPTGGTSLSQTASVKIILFDSGAPVTAPWISAIIDSATDPGHVSQLAGGTEFASLIYGGNWSDTYERGRFIYRPITGDQMVTTRIEVPTPSNQWNPGYFALCVRESLDQTGRMAAVYVRDPGASGGVKFSTRAGSWVAPTILPASANSIQPPCWVRVTRLGDTFTGEVSTDGTHWTTLGSNTVPGMPATALWGFFQCSNTYLGDHQLARFTNIQVLAPPAPGVPTNLAVNGIAPSTIRVSWTPPQGASAIEIERSLDGGAFAPLASLAGTATSHDASLSAGVATYTYRVRASNAAGSSEWTTSSAYMPQPNFQLSASTISGGDGDEMADRNEAPNLAITISNTGLTSATGVTATLTSATAGVTVLEPQRTYPDLAIGASGTSTLPFVIDIAPDLPNGASISLNLTVTSAQGSITRSLSLPLSAAGWTKSGLSNSATITPGTTNIGNSGDDVVTSISLPFSVNFRGANYSTVRASSNGNLQFTTNTTQFGNSALPDANLGAAAHVFWDDLATDSSGLGIFTSISGTAPNRIFNIEWRAEVLNSGNLAVNFQARLFENQSRVDFIYGSMGNSGTSATVGVQDYAAGTAIQHSHNSGVITQGLHLSFTYESETPMGPGRPDTDADGLPDWWTVTHFGTRTGSAGTQSRATDTPAGDGLPNLVKYALGLEPAQAGDEGRLTHGINADRLTFTYTRPDPAPDGLLYNVESSDDLASWSATGNTEVSSIPNGGLRTITISDSESLDATPRRFMRLHIEPAP